MKVHVLYTLVLSPEEVRAFVTGTDFDPTEDVSDVIEEVFTSFGEQAVRNLVATGQRRLELETMSARGEVEIGGPTPEVSGRPIVTHGDNADCPLVVRGYWPRCLGHYRDGPTPEEGANPRKPTHPRWLEKGVTP